MANISDNAEFKKIVDDAVNSVIAQLSTTNTRGRVDVQITLQVADNGDVVASVSALSKAVNSAVQEVGTVGTVS